MGKMQKEGLRENIKFWFNATQTTCASIITLLALYGVFVTDIPALLVNQLRADLANAKYDLVDIKKEKNELSEDVKTLEATIEEEQRLLAQIKEERSIYFDTVNRSVLKEFKRFALREFFESGKPFFAIGGEKQCRVKKKAKMKSI